MLKLYKGNLQLLLFHQKPFFFILNKILTAPSQSLLSTEVDLKTTSVITFQIEQNYQLMANFLFTSCGSTVENITKNKLKCKRFVVNNTLIYNN